MGIGTQGSKTVRAARPTPSHEPQQPGRSLPSPRPLRRGRATLQTVAGDPGEGPGVGARGRGHEPQQPGAALLPSGALFDIFNIMLKKPIGGFHMLRGYLSRYNDLYEPELRTFVKKTQWSKIKNFQPTYFTKVFNLIRKQ